MGLTGALGMHQAQPCYWSQTKRGLYELQDKITSVSKMAQQEMGRQLNESIELTDPLNKRIEDILKAKGEVSSLTSYPSSESL